MPLPYRLPFTISIASSSEAAWITVSTGPEDLLLGDLHVGRDAVEHRRPDERAAGLAGRLAAVHEHRRAALDPTVDPAEDAVAGGLRDDRPDVGAALEAVTDRERLGAGHELIEQGLLGVAHGDHDRPGHAALPGGAERRPDDVGHGLGDDGVGHDHHEVLGAAQGLHALAVGGGALVDVLGHLGRADERDRVDAGMVEEGVHDVGGAVHEVDDARGDAAEIVDQVEDELLRQRAPARTA